MFQKKKGSSTSRSMNFLKKKDITNWSVAEVMLWLDSINLSEYREIFHSNDIDGELLADLDEDDLIAMPISRMRHRKKILESVSLLTGKGKISPPEKEKVGNENDSDGSAGKEAVTSDSTLSPRLFKIKCLYLDEVRVLTLRADETYESFQSKIKDEFGSSHFAKYRDEEGDMISIRNSDDLHAFLKMGKSGKAKLMVYSKRTNGKEKKKSSGKVSRKRSDTSEEDFGVLENFVNSVIVIDRRGIIQFFNGSAEDMFGYDREEVVGQNVRILMNPEDSKRHNSYLRRYRR